MNGLRIGAVAVPETELVERFSHSSGPGGQSVNTSDTRVELRWDISRSAALTDSQRSRLLDRFPSGMLVVVAAEYRSQWRNRQAARVRMSALLAEGLRPAPTPRRPTRPSRTARENRIAGKKRRSQIKQNRARPNPYD